MGALVGTFGFGAETMDLCNVVEGGLKVVYLLLFVEDLAVSEGLFGIKYSLFELLVATYIFEVNMGHLCINLHQNLALNGSQRIDLILFNLL